MIGVSALRHGLHAAIVAEKLHISGIRRCVEAVVALLLAAAHDNDRTSLTWWHDAAHLPALAILFVSMALLDIAAVANTIAARVKSWKCLVGPRTIRVLVAVAVLEATPRRESGVTGAVSKWPFGAIQALIGGPTPLKVRGRGVK